MASFGTRALVDHEERLLAFAAIVSTGFSGTFVIDSDPKKSRVGTSS
jgi:hypothetical protein